MGANQSLSGYESDDLLIEDLTPGLAVAAADLCFTFCRAADPYLAVPATPVAGL